MREMKATLLQQVESHLLKVSLIKLSREFKKKGLDARIVACLHDSIWAEVQLAEEPEIRMIMKEVMTTDADMEIPLEVDID